MIHVLLTILKIIGIILLVIIALLLLIIALVLLVPVRYKIEESVYDRCKGRIEASWLMHLISGFLSYDEGGVRYRLRILFFDITSSEKKSKAPEKVSSGKVSSGKVSGDNTDDIADDEDDSFQVPHTNPAVTSDTAVSVPQEPENSDERSIFARIKDKADSVINTLKSAYTRTEEFKHTLHDKYTNAKNFINDKDNRELFNFLKKQLIILLKHIAPRRYKIYIKYGADSPEITGKVTGAVAVAIGFMNGLPYRKGKFSYVPVFTDSIFEAEVLLKGRIRVLNLLVIAIRVYFNEQFKKTILKK